MLKNYLTIAWRTLLKNRLYTAINVFGLTVGISSCLVIYLIVSYELSFNTAIPDAERIYRVYTSFSGVFDGTNRGVSTAVQGAVTDQFTGLDVASAFHTFSTTVKIPAANGDKLFEGQNGIAFVSSAYFDLLSDYKWLSGSAKVLNEPGKIVLTESQARKYFGSSLPEEVIGQTVFYQDSLSLMVAGIVQPPAGINDFHFTDFVSKSTTESSFLKQRFPVEDWESTNSSAQLFVKLSAQSSVEAINQQLGRLDEEHKKKSPNLDWIQRYKLQPLADLHYDGELGIFDGSRPAAHLSTLTILSFVAAILLVLASINFINLETAQAVRRAKEVGIRKVLGSSRWQLIRHFLLQSFLLTLVAVVVAIPVAELGLIFFNDFVPQGVGLDLLSEGTIIFLTSVIVLVGLFSGMYPAFVLSSFLPALALKNFAYINSSNSRSAYLRKGLIVFQFASAQLLIIGTLVVVSQIQYMLNKDLGFDREAVIHINTPWKDGDKRLTFRNEIQRLAGVQQFSMCQSPPATNGFSSNGLTYKNGNEEVKTSAIMKFGDPNYLQVYNIKLLVGRNLAPNHDKEILVNEALLHDMGIPLDEAIGKEIIQNKTTFIIVGVVKNFHIFTLHAPFKPIYINSKEEGLYGFSIKLPLGPDGSRSFAQTIASIERVWQQVYPDRKFEYTFVDETVRNFYHAERKMSKLAGTATGIAIIISCLGLFGLASYSSIQRSKEVGIRKVMGATVNNIVMLLSSDFLKLVVIAFVISAPVAWWAAERFLDDYAFHFNLRSPLFIGAGLFSMILAFVTVSYQALKTAWTNPVHSLRTE